MSARAPSKPVSASAPASLSTTAEEVLAKAQSGRTVVQDFCPLAESLEWQLGQEYLRDRGNKAFIGDASPVPYVVNNDGSLSYHAADVFFTSLVEAEKAGQLGKDEDIFALELGIGVGLFARFFLDAFRDLCAKHDKDYYDRFCYIAADRSERMLMDLCRHGVLANHPGRYRVRQVDAMKPEEFLPTDVAFRNLGGRPLRAVFLNYLLDCLPAAVLEIEDDQVKELHVRTVVARNVKLEDYTDLTAEQLKERAKFTDPASRRELLEVYGLFASEYDYRPVDLLTMPYGEFALKLAKGTTKYFLHSYGAIESLEKLMGLVHPRGFILMNDYGSEGLQMEHQFEHQRFSLATFVGVNFAELGECFGCKGSRYQWVKPMGQGGGIHSRLLAHTDDFKTHVRFMECFGTGEYLRLQEPLVKARQWLQVGRFELAADEYRAALKLQPYNWVLLNEISMFLIFQYRDLKLGIDMAKLALAQNPTCSAELWNTLGDGLFEFGRLAEARSAYQKGLTVNSSDVRARYNLAWVYIREKNFPAALEVIAEALALDKMGQYRDRLLQKQQEALAWLHARNQQEYLLLINLVSKHSPGRDGRPTPESAREEDRPTTT